MFERLTTVFSSFVELIAGEKKLSESTVDQLLAKVHDALIDADVPYDVTTTFVAALRTDIVGMKITKTLKPQEQVVKVVHDTIVRFLGNNSQELFTPVVPSTCMVVGLQGSGKTTTLVKLAHYIQREAKKRGKQRKILLASVDFYRPAALDQLEIGARSLGIDFYRSSHQDVIAAYARDHGYEHLLLDTAGRLHLDTLMLTELQQTIQVVKPRYTFMVLDAMMGQQSLVTAQAFDQAVGFHAALLTKMDSDTRGGVAFAFRYVLAKPIFFIGTGEKVDDLQIYKPERIAGRLLGMGDLLSLAEQAEDKIKESERKKVEGAFMSGRITLQDFASQLDMMNNLGSLSNLAKYMPGFSGAHMSSAMIVQGETTIKKYRAIIHSMTLKERLTPGILTNSRMQRIARGAGVTVQDIKDLLNRFEQTQQFVKLIKTGGISRFFKH